jgi:hypothetical protein
MSAALIGSAMLPAEHPEKTSTSKNQLFENKHLEKKEQGWCLALTIVSTLFPRKFGFDFD